MIICLSGFVIAGTSPTGGAALARDQGACDRMVGLSPSGAVLAGAGAGAGAGGARYAPHHHQLLHQFSAKRLAPGAGRSSSSSAESVSSHSASPPPPLLPQHTQHTQHSPHAQNALAAGARHTRVRTLYACLGESEGELSFEPNQIITNVAPSGEPGWLRGTLNGKTGLVPENYIEPLP